MGWSNSAMAVRYQHLTTQVRRDIAKRVGGLLWEAPKDPPEDGDQGAAGVRVPAAERQLRPELRPQAERPAGSSPTCRAFRLFRGGGEGI